MHPTCPQQPLLPAEIPTFHMWQSGRGSGKWGPGWTLKEHPFPGLRALCLGSGPHKGLFKAPWTTGQGLVACHDATVANQLAVPGWAHQVRPVRTAADQSGSEGTNTACRWPWTLVTVDLCHLLMAKATWPPVWHQWTLGTNAHSCSLIHDEPQRHRSLMQRNILRALSLYECLCKREDQTELTVAPCKGMAYLTSGGTHKNQREAFNYINIINDATYPWTS